MMNSNQESVLRTQEYVEAAIAVRSGLIKECTKEFLSDKSALAPLGAEGPKLSVALAEAGRIDLEEDLEELADLLTELIDFARDREHWDDQLVRSDTAHIANRFEAKAVWIMRRLESLAE